jgi:O-antigen/teichoic acid export membrane protein
MLLQLTKELWHSLRKKVADLRTQRDGTFSNLILLVAAFTGAGIFNYLYHLIMGRLLSPEDYAVVVAFIALTVTVTAPFGVTQTVLADFSTLMLAQGMLGKLKYVIRRLFLLLGLASLLLAAAVFVGRRALARILHIESTFVEVALVLSLVATLGVPGLLGIAQGSRRYGVISIARTLSAAGRLIIAALLVMLGLSLEGALTGVTLGTWGMLIFLTLAVGGNLQGSEVAITRLEWGLMVRHAGFFAMSRFALALLISSDVIFATARFPSEVAGYYGGASVLGSILLFLVLPIQVFLFPEVNSRFARGESTDHQLLRPMAAVAASALLFTGAYFLFPRWIVGVYYGPQYAPAAKLLGIYAIASSGGAIMALQATFNTARHEWRYLWLLCAGALIQALLMGLVLHQPSAYIVTMAIVAWLIVLIGEVWLGGIFPRRTTQ